MTEKKPRKTAKKAVKKSAKKATKKVAKSPKVVLLAGGNPQIPKGDGDAVVQSYISAMPTWKRAIGRQLDAIIERNVPDVKKAVKWNSPFYGLDDGGWLLSYHCFAKYVKVSFLRGKSLRPMPPGESKHPEVRYLDIYEDAFDDAQFSRWVKQASKLTGVRL